jgi:hypothetical protein
MLSLSGELLLELGFHSAGESFTRRSRSHPVVTGFGISVMGGVAGLITSLIVPTRILPSPVPGISLLLSPILAGVVMHSYGQWRNRRGGDHSYVATFWGGAIFALNMAVVRFMLVGR